MVRETPEMYEKVVVPYIRSFPPERLDWYDIPLSNRTLADRWMV